MTVSRRNAIRLIGTAGAFAPVLPSLLSRRALAQGRNNAPLRFVFFQTPNAQMEPNFFPEVPHSRTSGVGRAALSSLGALPPVFGPGWGAFISRMSILRGLDIISASADHCRSSFLCGSMTTLSVDAGAPRFGCSADWLIENAPTFYPSAPTHRALRFSHKARGFSFSNTSGSPRTIPFIDNEVGFFNLLFPSAMGAQSDDGQNQRRLVIERVLGRFGQLGRNSRLSGDDKQRLESHAEILRHLRDSLQTASPQCRAPALPPMTGPAPRRALYENLTEMIVAAFSCDVSRIANVFMEDFHDTSTDYSHYHDVSHNSPSDQLALGQSATHNRWVADRVLRLVSRLGQTPDIDGRTLLDNTIVMWGNECSSHWHRNESIPTVLVGGVDWLNHGNSYDFRQAPLKYYAGRRDFPAQGRPYTQLLCGLMLVAGVDASVFRSMGQGGFFGEWTSGTYTEGAYDQFASVRNDKLPLLFK